MIAPKIPKNEIERLADLIALNLAKSDKKEQFDAIILILSKCLKVPIAYISTIDEKSQNIHASCGLNFKSSSREVSFCGHTILQSDVLMVEDTLMDPRFHDNPMVTGEPKIRFYAGFPLVSSLGNNIGALCIADIIPRKLEHAELKIFKTIGKLLEERIRMLKLGDLQQEIGQAQKELKILNEDLAKKNQFYQKIFGQYMSDSLLKTILQDKKYTQLGGEKRYVTVLISDIRGFTRISDQHDPRKIIEALNIYFNAMIPVIHKYDGYINEILGDGILVIFGAPMDVGNCAEKAVLCAREMQQKTQLVNKKLKALKFPVLTTGIGINSGELIAGNIGSTVRMKYGVVGEVINIAARLESSTIGGQILITESTFNGVKDWVEPIGKIRTKVKGYENPISVYDVSEI